MVEPCIVLGGDPHITLIPPEGRAEGYEKEVGSVFRQIAEVCATRRALAFADTGDVMHRMGHTTHAEVVTACTLFNYVRLHTLNSTCLGNLGNHDWRGPEQLAFAQHPVGVLHSSGVRKLLADMDMWHWVPYPGGQEAVLVIAMPYEKDGLSPAMGIDLEISRAVTDPMASQCLCRGVIVLTHTETITQEFVAKVRENVNNQLLPSTPIVIANGHIHSQPTTQHYSAECTVVVHLGALMRTAFDQKDVVTSVAVVTFPHGSRVPMVELVPLKTEPPELAFKPRLELGVDPVGNQALRQFVGLLASGSTAVDAKQAVIDTAAHIGADKGTLDVALATLSTACQT